MNRLAKIFLGIFCITGLNYSQSVLSDYYSKIQKKLDNDKKYLNIYYVAYQPTVEDVSSLQSIPLLKKGGSFSFKVKEGVVYQIYFIRDNLELDSLVLLYVKQIEDKAASSESLFGQAGSNTADTMAVLTFGDLQELYFSEHPAYSFLYKKVVDLQLNNEDAKSLLGISLNDKTSKSKGVTSPDNIDFLSFRKINGIHRYPGLQAEAAKKAGGSLRRKSANESVDNNGTEYQFDASFSQVSFFHNSMELGFGSISAEIGLGAKGLNQVPWKTMAMNIGIRSLLFLSSTATQNIRRDFIIDAKIMGRVRIRTYRLINNLPFVFGDKPALNVGSGLVLDLSGTRLYGLPFFNVYIAIGSKNIVKPYSTFGPSGSAAYFSFKQWEMSWSFFWNSSEERNVRYNIDLGVGNYDVYRADYQTSIPTSELVYNKIKPFVAFNINFVPLGIDFLGILTKFSDNVLNFNLWIRLLEFDNINTIRLETTYYSAPMFRNPYPWETQNGNSIVQVRYRYGF